jgi:hypothetical protein
MSGTTLEKFAHLATADNAAASAEAPTPKEIVNILNIFCEFGTFECTTHGLSEADAARKRREFDCAILAEIAAHLPNVPNTRANADFLRHHLNGHSMNTLEGKKAIWGLVNDLPDDNVIRQAFAIPSKFDPDLSDPKIVAIPKEEFILVDAEFEGDTPPCRDYRVFQFPELS